MFELAVYAGSPTSRAKLWQDVTWAELPEDLLPKSGLGSAWIDVQAPELMRGRCVDCLTILRDPPGDVILVRAESIRPAAAPSIALRVRGELQRLDRTQLTPPRLAQVWRAQGEEDAETLRDEFSETAPGRWTRSHVGSTSLRCVDGGARRVEFRTTWYLQPSEPKASGIGAIELFGAGACEKRSGGGS